MPPSGQKITVLKECRVRHRQLIEETKELIGLIESGLEFVRDRNGHNSTGAEISERRRYLPYLKDRLKRLKSIKIREAVKLPRFTIEQLRKNYSNIILEYEKIAYSIGAEKCL